MTGYKLFSSDSHVSEPPDLWLNRIDKEFLFRAPRVELRERDGRLQDFMIYEGFPPHPVSVGLAAAAAGGDKHEFQPACARRAGKRTRGTYKDARPGGWDPAERLKDQDIDGVDGEVLHCTLGFRLFWLKDAALQRACLRAARRQAVFRAYNDWLAEYVSYNPKRFGGIALISLYDIELARQELRRTANLGLKGAMIWISPPPDRPYSSFEYDPFWAEAQDLGMPIVLHQITGFGESRLSIAYWDPHMVLFGVIGHHEAERTLATLILSGVLERFPRLRIVSAENGADWIPGFLHRIDRAGRFAGNSFPTQLTLKPSEYFHRQVFVTYIDEPEACLRAARRQAVQNRHIIGVDNLMWASDYPHFASTWPKSQEIVARDFPDASAEERRKIVRDNVLRVYNMAAVAVEPEACLRAARRQAEIRRRLDRPLTCLRAARRQDYD